MSPFIGAVEAAHVRDERAVPSVFRGRWRPAPTIEACPDFDVVERKISPRDDFADERWHALSARAVSPPSRSRVLPPPEMQAERAIGLASFEDCLAMASDLVNEPVRPGTFSGYCTPGV